MSKVVALALAALTIAATPAQAKHIRCSFERTPIAEWRIGNNHYRIKLGNEPWSNVPAESIAPMLLLLVFSGASCITS